MKFPTLTVVGHWGAYPGPGEASSCYLLRAGEATILLDCGSGALSCLQDFIGLQEIDAVVLSHYHSDHIADIGCLQYAARIDMDLGRRKKPLDIYGHDQSSALAKLDYLEYARGHAYKADSVLKIGPFAISFALTEHPDPCFAIRVELDAEDGKKISVVYTGDTGWKQSLVEFARGADVLVAESSLYDDYKGKIPGHLCAGEAGSLAAEAEAGRLLLTHLPHYGTHGHLLSQACATFKGPVDLARKGLVIELRGR
jgi:ribonuclease BN (tRNA processing enzyme)